MKLRFEQRSEGRILRPLQDFFKAESSSGLLLLAGAIASMVWANSPWKSSYGSLWDTRLAVGFSSHVVDLTLHDWLNDGVMAFFFLVVGLEIKRELADGELRSLKRALLPVIAAIGGVITPAAIFLIVNAGGQTHGWGIPIATDIALALGVATLLGNRVSSGAKLLLLALAIVDDIIAILVIAVFYSDEINFWPLSIAFGLIAAVVLLRYVGVHQYWPYLLIGMALWLSLHEAHVHPTLAGVAMGLLAPVNARKPEGLIDAEILADVSSVDAAFETAQLAKSSVSVTEWLEHLLHPWTSYVVLPLFALANVGIEIRVSTLKGLPSSTLALGIVSGLVLGKTVGVSLFAFIACKMGLAELPPETSWRQVVGVGALAGIGFTVALFVTNLALSDAIEATQAKLAVLIASVLAAGLAVAIFPSKHRRLGQIKPPE